MTEFILLILAFCLVYTVRCYHSPHLVATQRDDILTTSCTLPIQFSFCVYVVTILLVSAQIHPFDRSVLSIAITTVGGIPYTSSSII